MKAGAAVAVAVVAVAVAEVKQKKYFLGGNQMNKEKRNGSTNLATVAIAGLVVIFIALLTVFSVLLINMNSTKKTPPKEITTTSVAAVNQGSQAETTTTQQHQQADIPAPSVQPSDVNPVTMYIANVENSVYFRSEPKEVDSNIMTTIAVGTAVTFLKNEGNTFAKIQYNGQTGYVKRDYLSQSIPKKKDTVVVDNSIKYYLYVVNVPNSVYLRKGPSSNSGHYTTIPLGEMVGFIEKSNSTYSKVSYNGQIGYVTSKYLGDQYSAPSDNYMTVYNVKAAIYLRSEPVEKKGNIICEIPVGSKVKFLDYGNGTFYRISWNGMTGYSKSEYLTW